VLVVLAEQEGLVRGVQAELGVVIFNQLQLNDQGLISKI
jgi:hypothetical protein